jgi:PIN domain nuclease of toxin-antitoxin system
MRLLLDTHIFIWTVAEDVRLSKKAREIMAAAGEIFVSSASIWEAAIKIAIGKLDADVNGLVRAIETSGFKELPIHARHAAVVRGLPLVHHDPFDRILIAQAMSEPLLLLTADQQLSAYSDLVCAV